MKSDRNYVYTERAHFMCPDMHFGIMAKIERNCDERQLRQSIDALQNDLPSNSDLPLISKWIIGYANRSWKKEGQQVAYEAYIQKHKMKREIFTVCNQELEEILTVCKQQSVTVNDWLIAKMMLEENTNKVVIAADIRNQTKCYKQGAMGNYSTAFSVSVKRNEENVINLAKRVASQVIHICQHPQREMLVLACYIHMLPELIDAVAISTLGDFESKAGAFVGKNMFGYGSQNGYSITNLGKFQSNIIAEAVFIPPASPANKKTWGVLTVNRHMKICTSDFIAER